MQPPCPLGRVSALAHDLGGTSGDITISFGYNQASQIVTRARSNDAYVFGQEANVARTYAVNGLNQYLSAGTATFCYDGNGNLTLDGARVYRYDVENRLVEARAAVAPVTACPVANFTGALQASLKYDPPRPDGTRARDVRAPSSSGQPEPAKADWACRVPQTRPRRQAGFRWSAPRCEQSEQESGARHRAPAGIFITIIFVDRPDQCRQTRHADPGHVTNPRLGLEQVGEMDRGIMIGPALRNGEPIDLADMLLEPAADIERAARLDAADHRQHIGAAHNPDIGLAQHREHIALKPGEDAGGMARIERGFAIFMPGPGRDLECHRRLARRPGARILSLSEHESGFGPLQAGLGEADLRIGAEREELLAPLEPVLHPPELRAVGADEQMEAFAVCELVILGALRGVADFEFLEGHGVFSSGGAGITPQNTPGCKSTSWALATWAGYG